MMKNTRSRSGRKRKVLTASLCLLLGMMTIVSSALADQYTYSFMFTVPVQVQNLSVYAKGIRLICSVKDQAGNFLTENFTGASYGNSYAAIDSKGGFSGTLTYAVKLMNPSEASKAKSYWCSIQPHSGSAYTNFQDCSSDTAFFCLKPGAPRTLQVQGPIQ